MNEHLPSTRTQFTLEGIDMVFLVRSHISLKIGRTLPQQRGWIRCPQDTSPSTFQGWDEFTIPSAIT
jgi:hypothetical protein